jgi:uncharacterized protein YrrD
MLQLGKSLVNRPVMSLRTGGEIAIALEPIINPDNLKIEGWFCQDRFSKDHLVLLTQDVREIFNKGIIVNDHDVLVDPKELIRLQKILELQYELINKPVVTTNKKRLGKINDYAVEMPTLYIQKLYVSQPLIKSLNGGGLSVDRNQIVEVTDRKVVVKDPLQPVKATSSSPLAVPLPSN